MRPFGFHATALAALLATAMAARGAKRKSLSKSGAFAAWIVGFLSIGTGGRGMLLLLFYVLGTAATKYRKEEKAKRDATATEGSVRGAGQVLACSAIAVTCSISHVIYCGEEQEIDFKNTPLSSCLACGVVAHYATCLADTFASEMGILALHRPVLITKPWVEVPPGTNGGVTLSGNFWSAIGGALIGFGNVLLDLLSGIAVRPVETIIFGTICGIIGSFIDSILGATVQISFYDEEKRLAYSGGDDMPSTVKHISGHDYLSNAQVNLASVLATTYLGGCIIGPLVFGWRLQ